MTELTTLDSIDLADLAVKAEAGPDALVNAFSVTKKQAENLCAHPLSFFLELEELELLATTSIELNVAPPDSDDEAWRPLESLSRGQKATAVLHLLLLDSAGPLVVDQPEDDLDNRFITEAIVPAIRKEKARRQFLLATHNANIPVLGDAELIVAMSATGEADGGQASVPKESLGAIDNPGVQQAVTDILEGG